MKLTAEPIERRLAQTARHLDPIENRLGNRETRIRHFEIIF